MVCSRGESLTLHIRQMISNKEMTIASATTDVLRTKGMAAFQEFLRSNAEQIGKLGTKLSADETNFNAFGRERREQMLLEYATGLVYFNSLTEQEQNGIVTVAQRQYDQNNQVMVSWQLGVYIAMIGIGGGLMFNGLKGSGENERQSQQPSGPDNSDVLKVLVELRDKVDRMDNN